MDERAIDGASLVERIRDRVRSHLPNRISLEDFASETGLSSARVHQIFSAHQDENFGAFCRRMRLEYACSLMRAFPDWSCTRVAFEAGFSESSDFSRSFKRQYGLNPNSWDRVQPLANALKKRQDKAPETGTLNPPGYSDAFSGEYAPVTVRKRAGERVVTLPVRNADTPGVLRQGFDDLERWLMSKKQINADRHFMGLSFDSTLDTPPEVYRFDLAYPVDESVENDGEFRILEIPDCDVAMMPCRGGTAQFISTWDYLLRGFIPNSGWREGPGPHLEVYYNDPRKFDMQYWDMDCIVRLSGKENENG